MKKVLLLSVCLIVSFLYGGGNLWASVSFSESSNNGTLTITVTGETTDDDATSVSQKMANSNYTKVVVVGGTVNDKFVQSIFYTQYQVNDKITSLDFSQTSYTSTTFAKSFFEHSENWRKGKLGITTLSLPRNITKIADESVQLSTLTEVVLPSSLTEIGKKAFMNTQLTAITFPEDLDKIDDAAFAFTPLQNLKFNQKLRYIGNSAFAYNNENIAENTLTIPASVKYIGPAAFHYHRYQDVYFQGNRAPVMPYGKPVVDVQTIGNSYVETTAFYSNILMGYGFNPENNAGKGTCDTPNTGWANRENYKNGSLYICIMHYPKTLPNEDDMNTYIDVTRKYITKTSSFKFAEYYQAGNETTALTASNGSTIAYNGNKPGTVEYGYQDTYLGEAYIWPSQNQIKRAYITAVNGVCWDGVTKYRPNLTEEEKKILEEAGYKIGTGEGEYTEDELSKMAHQGTRMFVLANNDSQSTPDYTPSIQKDGTWWTVCIPFNMTKKQVKDAFGENTQLCLFDQVTREIEVNGKNHILIRFATDPMKKKTADAEGKKMKWETSENADQENGHVAGEWKYSDINAESNDEPGDADIVIWAHESYMIKPMKGENADQDPTVIIANLEPVPGAPLPSVVRAKTVTKTQDEGNYDDCYRFVGNYETDVKMPQYSYFFGTGTNDKTEKFRFYTGTTSSWKANKSIIQANAHDGGAEDYHNFFGGNANNAKVMQTTIFGFGDDDNNTTGIDDVQIVVGNETLAPVFTLDGKMVNVSGETTGLAKGVYVKAGKKFVIQ